MRFGFACTSVLLANCSPNTGPTATRLEKVPDLEGRHLLLNRALEVNLRNTLRLIEHSAGIGYGLYRMTSNLVPLATHPVTEGWNWRESRADLFAAIGDFAARLGIKLSTHPGAYTVLSSTRTQVVAAAIADLEYHNAMLNAMGLPDARMVIHVGGGKANHAEALRRFAKAFRTLNPEIQRRLLVENDDLTFSVDDVLELCEALGIPVCFDIHHARVNQGPAPLTPALLTRVFATWPAGETPKVHVSSPRGPTEPRAHADLVDPADFRLLLELLDGRDCDVMIEAKAKDRAVLQLWSDLGWEKGVSPDAAVAAETGAV